MYYNMQDLFEFELVMCTCYCEHHICACYEPEKSADVQRNDARPPLRDLVPSSSPVVSLAAQTSVSRALVLDTMTRASEEVQPNVMGPDRIASTRTEFSSATDCSTDGATYAS
jgi:hypothetical protein